MKVSFVALTLLMISPLSIACSSHSKPTDEDLFVQARSVFRARILEAKVAKFTNPENLSEVTEVIEAKFEVKEVYKGEPPNSGVVRDLPYGIGNCSLGLVAGVEYVFFTGEYDLVWIPSGSFGLLNLDGNGMKPRLDELRLLGKRFRY